MLTQPTSDVLLFTKCSGYNDSYETTSPSWDATGLTDVIDCLNVTATTEGRLVKIPAVHTIATANSAINELIVSPEERLFAQIDSAIKEWNGTAFINVAGVDPIPTAGVKAKYIQTPLDIRISSSSGTYKLKNGTISAATIGSYTGPATSKVFNAMPAFDSGFVFNQKLYTAKGKFLQFSLDYQYDLFNLPDDYIGSVKPILQCGAIPGCILTMHADGVTVYVGTSPNNFIKRFYAVECFPGTLHSGFITKVYDYGHMFLCEDGVHIIDSTGKITNLTVADSNHFDNLNTTYSTAMIDDGRYLAFGDTKCLDYNLYSQCLTLRSSRSITASCLWNAEPYYADGTRIVEYTDETQNSEAMHAFVKLPYHDFGVDRHKQIRCLYFTGKLTGSGYVTVRNQFGQSVTKDISGLGYVQNYKITGLRGVRGPKLSVEIGCQSGEFKLEELRGIAMAVSSRY